MSDPQVPAQTEEERNAARKEAAVELGKAITIGLVPMVGQAIDAYDTIESAVALYGAGNGEAKEVAQFDFLLALVGWVPGPGDGVKKSLRIVNRDPQRFAPVLFDLLRFVLQECGIKTSPEALLDELFNAAKLRQQIDEIQKGVVDSSGFKSLPEPMQDVVVGTLKTARDNMPALVGVVQKRLRSWKKLQRNSSSAAVPHGRSERALPKAKDGSIAAQGDGRGEAGHANTGTHGHLATQALGNITNEVLGISGEHIADYICAYTFHWGTDWQGHDDGAQGQWKEGTPSSTKQGKLSKGGNPKAAHVLYKLTDGANGTGIDAVWRASGHNGGKPYAIVEAKATKDEDAPKFMRKLNNQRKPSVISKLGASGISDPSELLEPLEEDGAQGPAAPSRSTRRGGAQRGSTTPPKAGTQAKPAPTTKGRVTEVLVQMSEEWIEANISKAVETSISREIVSMGTRVYARHLFFSPAYHRSGSPAAHMRAHLEKLPAEQHASHDAFHYDENEVKVAVNKRKSSLRKKYGNLPSLKAES